MVFKSEQRTYFYNHFESFKAFLEKWNLVLLDRHRWSDEHWLTHQMWLGLQELVVFLDPVSQVFEHLLLDFIDLLEELDELMWVGLQLLFLLRPHVVFVRPAAQIVVGGWILDWFGAFRLARDLLHHIFIHDVLLNLRNLVISDPVEAFQEL